MITRRLITTVLTSLVLGGLAQASTAVADVQTWDTPRFIQISPASPVVYEGQSASVRVRLMCRQFQIDDYRSLRRPDEQPRARFVLPRTCNFRIRSEDRTALWAAPGSTLDYDVDPMTAANRSLQRSLRTGQETTVTVRVRAHFDDHREPDETMAVVVEDDIVASELYCPKTENAECWEEPSTATHPSHYSEARITIRDRSFRNDMYLQRPGEGFRTAMGP